MAIEEKQKLKKSERSSQRREAARKRVLFSRARRVGILVLVLAVGSLWAYEYSGADELAEAEVSETRRWRHYTNDGKSHPHLAATLEIEGLSEATLEKADGYARGQRVPVWIQRGRLTNWPRFLAVATPEELALVENPAPAALLDRNPVEPAATDRQAEASDGAADHGKPAEAPSEEAAEAPDEEAPQAEAPAEGR